MDFVVFDELGYLPFAQSGGPLLFHLISRLYERTLSHRHDQSRLRRMGEDFSRAEHNRITQSSNGSGA
jgi:DNA replication protein DnaC